MNMKGPSPLFLGLLVCAFIWVSAYPFGTTREISLPIQRSGEFRLISNPKTPKKPSLRIVFKEDLSIGVKEGDENYMFGERLWFNVDDEGNVYAVDWDRKRIQKYGPDGKYRLTIGRQGQGPGEFGNIWMPHFDGNRNLYVRDIVNHKVSFFELNGKLVKEIKMPEKAGDVQVNSRGDYVAYVSEEKAESDGGLRVIYHYGLFDKDFNPLAVFQQTTWTSSHLSGRDPESLAKFLAESMSNGALSPSVTLLLGRDDKIYVGYPDAYEIRVYSPDGKPDVMIRKDQPSRPVTGMHKKDYAADQERDFLSLLPAAYSESIRKKALSMIRYPKYLPAYQQFTLMDNGWLAVVVDTISGGPANIDIFDENGIYIAELAAPILVDGLKFKKDKAYAVMTTEEGYKILKSYSYEIKDN